MIKRGKALPALGEHLQMSRDCLVREFLIHDNSCISWHWRRAHEKILSSAPHAEYASHDKCLYESITRIDGVKLQWHVFMNDGAPQKHGLKPNPGS